MISTVTHTEYFLSLGYYWINLVTSPSFDAASCISANPDDITVVPHYSITSILKSAGGDASIPSFQYIIYASYHLLSNTGFLVYQISLAFSYILSSYGDYLQSVNV